MRRTVRIALLSLVLGCSTTPAGPRDAAATDERSDAAELDAAVDAVVERPDVLESVFIADHELVHTGCESTPVEPRWVAIPESLRECGKGGLSNCGDGCLYTRDCTEMPRGRCTLISKGTCEYGGGQAPGMACQRDDECTLSAGGYCDDGAFGGGSSCRYADFHFDSREYCDVDAECELAPGGHCLVMVERTKCEYQKCVTGNDCGEQAACVCSPRNGTTTCVPANCREDSDCPGEHTCRVSVTVVPIPEGKYCTTDADTCGSDADCNPPRQQNHVCAFDKTAQQWSCIAPGYAGP